MCDPGPRGCVLLSLHGEGLGLVVRTVVVRHVFEDFVNAIFGLTAPVVRAPTLVFLTRCVLAIAASAPGVSTPRDRRVVRTSISVRKCDTQKFIATFFWPSSEFEKSTLRFAAQESGGYERSKNPCVGVRQKQPSPSCRRLRAPCRGPANMARLLSLLGLSGSCAADCGAALLPQPL